LTIWQKKKRHRLLREGKGPCSQCGTAGAPSGLDHRGKKKKKAISDMQSDIRSEKREGRFNQKKGKETGKKRRNAGGYSARNQEGVAIIGIGW